MRPMKTKWRVENGSMITACSEQSNVACKRFPWRRHITCTKRRVLKIPGSKVMQCATYAAPWTTLVMMIPAGGMGPWPPSQHQPPGVDHTYNIL